MSISIARSPTRGKQRLLMAVAAALLAMLAVLVPTTGQAHASDQACTGAPAGLLCIYINGSGGHVNYVNVDRDDVAWVCNYSTWFFYIPPTGGAYGLGYYYHAGCDYLHVWFNETLNRNFPLGTNICTKFFENNNESFIGQKCIRVS